jgi:hypothetical protein
MCPAGMVSDVGETTRKKSPPLIVADPKLPVPPSVDVTFPVVLVFKPDVVTVTFTVTAHEELAAIVPLLRAIPVPPFVAPVTEPPQVSLKLGVAATCKPAGKLSATATPLSAVALGLEIVNVKLVEPPTETLAAPKALAMLAGASTVRLAVLLVVPVPPSVELTALVVLLFTPAVVPVTFTLMLHEVAEPTPPPLRLMPVLPADAPSVPPQVLEFDETTESPDGKLSVNASPVSPSVVFGLAMLTVSVVLRFRGMLDAPNAFEMVGGATTVMLAVPAAPLPVSVELAVVELFFTPAVVPVTFSLTLQNALAAKLPPLRLKLPLPLVAPVTVPPQLLLDPPAATVSPAGRLSVNETPVRARLVLLLVIVSDKLVVPLSGMVVAPKDLLTLGGVATVRFAEAVLPVPPLVEVTLPVVLVNWPDAAPVTVTLNWHWLFVAIVAPVKAIPVGAVVVSVPPQTVAEAFATVRPVGKVSVNATPVSATALAAGLVTVNVSEVVAFNAIDKGLKTFAIDGGATTLILADAVPPVPPSVEVTLPVVLFFVPAVVPVTFTENVQEEEAARLAAERLTLPAPATEVIVPPPQVPVRPFGVDTTSPVGNVSMKPTPVRVVVVLLF